MSKYRKGKSTTPPSLAAAARIRGSWRVKSIYWSSLAILYIHRYPSSWGCAPLPHRGGSHPLWDPLPGQTVGKGLGTGPLFTHTPALAPVAGRTWELIAAPLAFKVSVGRADGHSPFQHGISFTNRLPNPNAGCAAQSQSFSCVRGGAWIRSEHRGPCGPNLPSGLPGSPHTRQSCGPGSRAGTTLACLANAALGSALSSKWGFSWMWGWLTWLSETLSLPFNSLTSA